MNDDDSYEILSLLGERRNALLIGPPATGKSILLAKIAEIFERGVSEESADSGPPAIDHDSDVPIPEKPAVAPKPGPKLDEALPALGRKNRKVFRAVLHPGSKNREFLTGIVPDVRKGADAGQFRILQGVLYRASEYAKAPDAAALLIIDEINRGPAVQVFGGAIAAMEGEKRLNEDGTHAPWTQVFDLLNPESGEIEEYAFPPHLYLLAAMNQADVSVEPLDVAFLRRWASFRLEPSVAVLREHFKLGAASAAVHLPPAPTSAQDVYEAAVRAWIAVNAKIELGRGPEFRVGHGVMMAAAPAVPADLAGALKHIATTWRAVRTHIDEAFFGDTRGMSVVLNAGEPDSGKPYILRNGYFGDSPRYLLQNPANSGPDSIYGILLGVAG